MKPPTVSSQSFIHGLRIPSGASVSTILMVRNQAWVRTRSVSKGYVASPSEFSGRDTASSRFKEVAVRVLHGILVYQHATRKKDNVAGVERSALP